MDETEKIIEKLKKEHPIEDLVSFNELDLQQKLQDNSFLVIKYKEFWIKEKATLEELEGKFDLLIARKYDHFRFESPKQLSKPEIEKYYIPGDKQIIQMQKIVRNQKIRVEFFDMCWRGLEKVAWSMKVFSDNERRGI